MQASPSDQLSVYPQILDGDGLAGVDGTYAHPTT